jgi:transcriptional regulator with XRE-family HTH domain
MPTQILLDALARLRSFREEAALSQAEAESALLLGPGWIQGFENGDSVPALDVTLAMLALYGRTPAEMFSGAVAEELPKSIQRLIYAEVAGDDLLVRFEYAKHDAVHRLTGASLAEFETVIKEMRDGLALLADESSAGQAIKMNAVVNTFLKAVELWPHANPSDLWWFIVNRAYNDPFNHPAKFARLSFEQSWKRTGGWALEEILVRHYAPTFVAQGLDIFIATGEEKARLIEAFDVEDRLEADKVDVFLAGFVDGQRVPFGVVHVKASFAERRTDDVPMSAALVRAGYTSPLWTMDCKSTPSESPTNRGELGAPKLQGEPDGRSAKRKDIEDDGYFSACFSYNSNTAPTPSDQECAARIIVADFANPSDAFTEFVAAEWRRFRDEPE